MIIHEWPRSVERCTWIISMTNLWLGMKAGDQKSVPTRTKSEKTVYRFRKVDPQVSFMFPFLLLKDEKIAKILIVSFPFL